MIFPNRKAIRPGTTRRVRQRGYNYSAAGYYFVTICTHERHSYFGVIENGEMTQSPAGAMVHDAIASIPDFHANTTIDAFVVMPNHVHILIGLAVRIEDIADETNLIDIVQWLKTTTHRRFGDGVKRLGWKPYSGKVWQSSFHDHIVRNERELGILRDYVANNVYRWGEDEFY
ncbi:MAG: transposase [Thermomicrobiales bacterium]|nr:transposase [Thermomicrobiales bacterium]